MAKWMPCNSRPGTFKSRECSAPPESRMASNSLRKSSTGTSVADMRIRLELDTLGRHLLDAAVDQVLLHLEIRDAVAQQAADAIALFEDRHPVAGARELLRGGKPRGTGTHHSHALARAACGRLGPDPTLPKRVIDDGLLNLLDGHRGWLMPSTQAASHGAGQIRPVNSGKLLVECSTRMASRQRPR